MSARVSREPRLSSFVADAGRSVIVLAGTGFGLLSGLQALGSLNRNTIKAGAIEARLDTLDIAISRLQEQAAIFQAELDRKVNRGDLNLLLDQLFRDVEKRVESRLEGQNKSVDALRSMVAQTDQLLQQVLERLETGRRLRHGARGTREEEEARDLEEEVHPAFVR